MIKFYRRYQSLKKFGMDDTVGIEMGKSYVFPKVDGTNSQVWFDGEKICAGSRNRQLTLDNDNAGFYAAMIGDERLLKFFAKHPDIRLYGEWLVPHSLKTYRDDAWRKFYIFDVVKELDPVEGKDGDENFIYLAYDQYQLMLEEFGLDYINPIGIVKNASPDQYVHYLDKNGFLIKDGAGNGEGIVIKNYDYKNRFGRITWAKIITNEFKEKHFRAMGAPQVDTKLMEEKIVEKFVTEALIEKEYSKIVHEAGKWDSKFIPRLLNVVYYCLINEEMWNAVKEYKNPTVNFKALQNFTYQRVKEVKKDLF